jgi:crotonobetainyl-CoA:carnitine CoA-transferase CaiB-like acyl-CoA transferase
VLDRLGFTWEKIHQINPRIDQSKDCHGFDQGFWFKWPLCGVQGL